MTENSGLIDQFEQPIPRSLIAQMRQDIAGTDALDGRPPFAGHLAARMRPERLGAIMRAADDGNSLEWQIIAEEIEELFPHYLAVLSKRKRQVCQLPIVCQPADDSAEAKRHADFVADWLKTDVLPLALFDIADAMGKGFSVSEIVWEMEPRCVRPAALTFREQRFFEISWKDGETLWLRTQQGFADLAPHKFVVHKHPSKSGLTIRSGLTHSVAFLWMWSVYTLRDWALFTQAYGLPIRVGRYGPEASQTDKNVLWRAVSTIAGDIAAIIPKSMDLEIVNQTDRRGGAELYERRLDWLNREVSKLVLGSTAGTEAIAGGHAVGREHRQVEQDVERFDAGLLAATLTRQIVQPMVAFTFGEQAKYPTLQIGQPDQVPLQEFYPGVAAMIDRGLKVRAQEVRERFGLSAPEGDDEVLGPQTDIGAGQKPLRALPEDPGADMQAAAPLTALRALMAEQPPALVARMTDRLAGDAAGALAGMTEAVRHAFDQARDMHDLAERLSRLKLPEKAFAEAMARGLALANLVGRAEILDEITGGR